MKLILNLKSFCSFFLVFSFFLCSNGQVVDFESERLSSYSRAVALYQKGLFASAIHEFDDFLIQSEYLPFESSAEFITAANHYRSLAELKLHPAKGEIAVKSYINNYSPHSYANLAKFELARYYYQTRQYDQANDFFLEVKLQNLSDTEVHELHFKNGYCHFVRKRFSQAESEFEKIASQFELPYYYASNYYYGMCYYFKGDYSAASNYFERSSGAEEYKNLIPFYLAQIYFSQGQYDLSIVYIEKQLKDVDVLKKNELRQLLGQAYYQKGEYDKALVHLEYYENQTEKLTEHQFYQLAHTQYQAGLFDKAAENFRELSFVDSEIAQNARYYLADCYLKQDDKNSARVAFQSTSQLNYLPKIRDEALFNYGRLSAELNFDTDAINSLTRFNTNSAYYNDAQTLLSKIFLRSKDYDKTIAVLDRMQSLSTELKKAHQQVYFAKAVQLYRDGKKISSMGFFESSLRYPLDRSLQAQALYWLADDAYRKGNYNESIKYLGSYKQAAERTISLPEENALYMGDYLLGYNYLRMDKVADAGRYFESAYTLIDAQQKSILSNDITGKIYPDAILRTADCQFFLRKYTQAESLYNKAVQIGAENADYAFFQKSVIEGLGGQLYDQIVSLEELVKLYPGSAYAADALLKLGDIYSIRGNLAQASKVYRQLVRDYPTEYSKVNEAYLKLGLSSYNSGDLQRALFYYKAVLDNNADAKTSQEALLAIEEIYLQDLAQSREYLNFLETIPGYKLDNFAKDSVSFMAARIQFESQDYNRAIQGFQRYLEDYSAGYYSVEALYLKGESHNLLEQYEASLVTYDQLIEKGKSAYYEEALMKAALISFNYIEDFEKSTAYYRELENITIDEDVKLKSQIGGLQGSFRTKDKTSILYFANQLIRNENAEDPDKAFAHYCKGKVQYEINNLEDAMPEFEIVEMISDNIFTAEARFIIAEILYRQGEKKDAEVQARKAFQKSSNYQYWVGKSVLLLSDIYMDRNDLLSARAALEAIVENYKEDDDMLSEAKIKLRLIKKMQEEQNRISKPEEGDTLILDPGKPKNG